MIILASMVIYIRLNHTQGSPQQLLSYSLTFFRKKQEHRPLRAREDGRDLSPRHSVFKSQLSLLCTVTDYNAKSSLWQDTSDVPNHNQFHFLTWCLPDPLPERDAYISALIYFKITLIFSRNTSHEAKHQRPLVQSAIPSIVKRWEAVQSPFHSSRFFEPTKRG